MRTKMSVEEYIFERLKYEDFSFSWEELLTATGKSSAALKSELLRLSAKKAIINLRRGFYLIIPPRYANFGHLPIQLYADKLFRYLSRDYYVAFYTAAMFHGASHQKVQKEYVMTPPPRLMNIQNDSATIDFFNATHWPTQNLIDRKSDAGYFKLSSPALTAVDLLHYHQRLGGINRMLAVLEELSEEVTEGDMESLVKWYPHKSTLQRLGYILDELNVIPNVADQLFMHLGSQPYHPVLLSPRLGEKPGSAKNRWKIDANLKLENDL
jgi:predicted transcriptional regulator of viral defense system